MFKRLIITCDEATTICDKTQYGEATVIEKLKLQLHFLRCKICALYTKQNTLMSKMCDHHLKKGDSATNLSNQEKEQLKKELFKKD